MSRNSFLFDAATIARKPEMSHEFSTGKRFARLVVIQDDGPFASSYRRVRVMCDCGVRKSVSLGHLINGATRSCGCLCLETRTRHGHCKNRKRSKEYDAWAAMLDRCYNQKNKRYARYGGRGITVCQRWHRFEHFLADMGLAPSGLTLERKDNRLGYDPLNCLWADYFAQNNNRGCCRYYEYAGKRLTLSEWSRELGMGLAALQTRIIRLGWPINKAFTTPIRAKRPHGTKSISLH